MKRNFFWGSLLHTLTIAGIWLVAAFTIVEAVRHGTIIYFFPLHWAALAVVGLSAIDLISGAYHYEEYE